MNIIQDIKPTKLESAYINAPFDIGKNKLEKEKYHIISLEENAQLRMQEGKTSYISQNGNWTKEGILYIPNKGTYLTPNSPIMNNAKKASNCHRNGNELYLTNKQVEQSLEGSIRINDNPIPTESFGENPITAYAFGNSAKEYGKFLKEAGINKMPIWLTGLEDKPFARQMWLFRLDDGSDLLGDYRNLNYIMVGCVGYVS